MRNHQILFEVSELGPVIIPPDRLPEFIIARGRLSPATYAASALRQVLLGPVTWRLAMDTVFPIGMVILNPGFTLYRMDWRQRQ
jgi:ABC-2 type transport system permease protein